MGNLASGLAATFGFAQESAVGTFTPPNRFLTFDKESLAWKKNVQQSKALYGGMYLRGDRRRMTTFTADGGLSTELYDRGIGLLLANMLGSTPAPVAGSGATADINTFTFTPGNLSGESLTLQVARPTVQGNLVPFSYTGAKVTDWTLGVTASSLATLDLTFDAMNSSDTDTYAAPSYVESDVYTFQEASLLTGGTVSTASGVTTLTGATALATAKDFSLKGTNALDTDRYYLGGGGQKAEQLADDFRSITGQTNLDFNQVSDILPAYYGDTPLALWFKLESLLTPGAGLEILLPQVRWEGAEPNVDGPAVLSQAASFTALYDGTDPAIQIVYKTLDSQL